MTNIRKSRNRPGLQFEVFYRHLFYNQENAFWDTVGIFGFNTASGGKN